VIMEASKTNSSVWLSVTDRYARVGGPAAWSTDTGLPRFVEFRGAWPIISLELVSEQRVNRLQTSLQVRSCSWHAHVPRRRLSIPARFRIDAAQSRSCRRDEGLAHVFDFTGTMPLPTDNLDRRLIVLLEEIDAFRRHHPEVLHRLGIEVEVSFRDEPEDEFL
jgi:hypothetical protein